MATFSRALALFPSRQLTPRFICLQCTERQVTPSRFFSTSFLRLRTPQTPSKAVNRANQAVSRPPVAPKSSIAPSPSKSAPATAAPSRYAFIKSLSSKQTPTVLYEAPSHFWFYFGCWSIGIAILGWTALTAPTVIKQPEGISQWVGVVFGATYVLLVAMAFYLMSKTPNIVSTIRLLPSAGHPQLEVTVKRMVPFLKPKVITTNLENAALKSRFSLPEEYVPELKRLQQKMIDEKQAQKLHKFDMEHLLTMPFRRIGRAFSNMFKGVRSAWTDMGFGVIKVDGKQYKVDVTQGFAHDGFKTLEQIVTVGFK